MRSNWDNWGFIDGDGLWHMYYIVGGECPGRWVAYGLATSRDGVRWTDLGDVLYPLTQPCYGPSTRNSAPRSVRRALLTLQVNPGSLYHRGKST